MSAHPSRSTTGWRVFWTHYKGRDKCVGELWPDRESAEFIADTLRRSGYCLDVRIRRAVG